MTFWACQLSLLLIFFSFIFCQQVTVQNPENQGYLIAYKDSQLIVSSARWAPDTVWCRYWLDMDMDTYWGADYYNNSSFSLLLTLFVTVLYPS